MFTTGNVRLALNVRTVLGSLTLVAHEALHECVLEEILSYLQILPRVEFNWRTEAQTRPGQEQGR
jgi:hypothetical protein